MCASLLRLLLAEKGGGRRGGALEAIVSETERTLETMVSDFELRGALEAIISKYYELSKISSSADESTYSDAQESSGSGNWGVGYSLTKTKRPEG